MANRSTAKPARPRDPLRRDRPLPHRARNRNRSGQLIWYISRSTQNVLDTGQLHVEAVGRPERHLRTSIRNRLARLEQAAVLFLCIPNSPVLNRGVAGPRCRSVGSGCAAAAPPGCSRRSRSRSARVYLIPSGRRANTPARMLRPKPEDIARNAVDDPNCRLPHRLAREMRVARRRFLLAVTEKATDHRQRFA